jgi:hypothetical protein
LIHIVMDIFEIMIFMIKHILYVIIIMLIYGIKIIQKMSIFLKKCSTVSHELNMSESPPTSPPPSTFPFAPKRQELNLNGKSWFHGTT